MPDLVGAGLDKADQVGYLGGVADGNVGVVGFGDDEEINTAGSVGIVAVFGPVQGTAQADIHGALIGVIQDIGLGEVFQLSVAQFDGDDLGVGFSDGRKIVDTVQNGADVVELLHNFHKEGVTALEERDAGGVRGEGGELVAQHIGQARARDRDGIAVLDEQRTGNGKVHYLIVVNVFVEDIQQDLVRGMAGWVRDGIVVFRVGFGDAGAGKAFDLFSAGEAVLLSEFTQVILDVGARRADDIDIDGESSGRIQVEHQGRSAFENEWTAGTHQRFQQGKSADGFLYKRGIINTGYTVFSLPDPFQASASGVNHNRVRLYGLSTAVFCLRSRGGGNSGADGCVRCRSRQRLPDRCG